MQMSMKQFLLFMMLAGATYGLFQVLEAECDATQTTSPCSPALGGSVNITLMNNATGYKVKCYKNVTSGPEIVFTLNKRAVTIGEPYRNRTEFFIDTGTLKITNVKKDDTGQYVVTVHNANGQHEKDISFILKVKETGIAYLILGCALGALLIVAVCCYVCWRCCRKSGESQTTEQNAELQPSDDLNLGTIIRSKPY